MGCPQTVRFRSSSYVGGAVMREVMRTTGGFRDCDDGGHLLVGVINTIGSLFIDHYF